MKRGFTMLLADDDENDLTLFKQALEQSVRESGVNVGMRCVRDGAEAIAYLAGEDRFADRKAYPFPQLVVMDLKMPRLTGLDVLAWLKGHEEYRRIPKIMLSGSAQEQDIEEAYRLGVSTYFQKPSSLTEFGELFHYMIGYWAHMQMPVILHAGAGGG